MNNSSMQAFIGGVHCVHRGDRILKNNWDSESINAIFNANFNLNAIFWCEYSFEH